MDNTTVLKATRRDQTGTRATRKQRESGQLPAIIYGHKMEPVSVLLNYHDTTLAIQHGHRLLEIELDGKKESLLVKDLQYDYLGDTIIHLDLARVDLDERVTVTVEVLLKGTPAGINEGGALEQMNNEIEIECAVNNIPEEGLRVNVNELHLNETITANDVPLPDDTTLVTDPDTPIAICREIVEVEPEEELEEAAEGAEPEVIAREKAEEEEE